MRFIHHMRELSMRDNRLKVNRDQGAVP